MFSFLRDFFCNNNSQQTPPTQAPAIKAQPIQEPGPLSPTNSKKTVFSVRVTDRERAILRAILDGLRRGEIDVDEEAFKTMIHGEA